MSESLCDPRMHKHLIIKDFNEFSKLASFLKVSEIMRRFIFNQ